MGNNKELSKFSKKNRLLLTILLSSIGAVFCFLAILLYINFYTRVSIILTTITRYKDGDIKNVTEYDILEIKEGTNVETLPSPSIEGYVFGGWYFDKECNKPYDYSTILKEHIQLYGKFDLLEYSVELVLDDTVKVVKNISREFDFSQKLTIEDILKLPKSSDTIQLEDGTETTILEYKGLYKEGYTFEGWGFASTSEEPVSYDHRMTAQNTTFYAIWKPIQVELQYCTLDLSFAENDPQSGFVADRINSVNGGLKYTSTYDIYVSETLGYGSRVKSVLEPEDEYLNFVFAGWYLDPEFTVPVKFSQLYIRNGYFTLTKEKNINIMKDPLYFESGNVVDDDTFDEIMRYNSTDEENSRIRIFAKWELKKYTVKFNLNLPESGAYIDTSLMGDIIRSGIGKYVYSDNCTTIKDNSNVYQGQRLLPSYLHDGVLYDENYFRNVVYVNNDMSGLPLYTLFGWNSQKDGSGYDVSNATERYFDKSKFEIQDDEIILYAQWSSYNRINYYLTNYTGNNILLMTVNVENDRIEMPILNSLIVDITDRKVTFTNSQKEVNDFYDFSRGYLTPINRTFVGWTNSETYIQGSSELYIDGLRYNVGSNVNKEEGVYLGEPVTSLYSAWVQNTNMYSYDLGENAETVDFSKNGVSVTLEQKIIESIETIRGNVVVKYKVYTYDSTSPQSTIATIYNDEFLISKTVGGKLYSLDGWELSDGTKIDGKEGQDIKFENSNRYLKFINNSIPLTNEYSEVQTSVYYDGKVVIDNDKYFTKYSEKEDKSYIVLKARNVTNLIFNACWIKNIILTYDGGADDVVWASGYNASSLTNTAGGNVYMELSDIKLSDTENMVSRPYYKFYGWSTINREADDVINFNQFEDENIIYQPGTRYDLFEEDTTLYAVWQPLIYTINIFQQAYNSIYNSSAGRVYIAKECFTYNKTEVTDNMELTGNILKYQNANGDETILSMTTSAVTGYGLSAWSNAEGVRLVKENSKYNISIKNDSNSLFDEFPESNFSIVSIYPMFSVLKFNVKFNISGEGIVSSNVDQPTVTYDDIEYGTTVKSLLPKLYYNYYDTGYTFKGWNISGDVDYRGILKDDYILNISTSTLTVRSDMIISLIAEKLSYAIKLVFASPINGEIKEIANYSLNYYDSLDELSDNIEQKIAVNDFVGYTFAHWQTTIAGMTTNLTNENLSSMKATSNITLYAKYSRAKIIVKFNYENIGNDITEEKESEYLASISLNYDGFAVAPLKDKNVLKGWALSETDQTKYFSTNSTITISEDVVGTANLIKTNDGYELNFYAKWVESVGLTLNIDNATISYANFPRQLDYEKGTIVYFKDIPYISILSNSTISQSNGLGEYMGIWVDDIGREYNVTLTSTFLEMNSDITLTPKFNPKGFTITYNYKYLGDYYTINGASSAVNDNYSVAPTLHTKSEIDNYISSISDLSDYRSVGYYLSKSAYESNDDNFKFNFGDEFDFVNNSAYSLKANGSKFEFYIILQKVVTLTYYSDRDASAVITTLKFDEGLTHIIGDTNNNGTLDASDIIPSKTGFEFKGWSSDINVNYVQHTNGERINTGVVDKLFPVWEAKPLRLEYCDGSDVLGYRDDLYFDDITTLKIFTQDGKKLSGWATSITGDVEYSGGSSLDLSQVNNLAKLEGGNYVIRLYAVWEIAYYSVKFEVYSTAGALTTMYGQADGTISMTEYVSTFNSTQITFALPTTATSYVVGGQKYLFSGSWTDGTNTYNSSVITAKFTKDYVFSPIYNKVHALKFVNGVDEIYVLDNVLDGTTFAFSSSELNNATNSYNSTLLLSGSKVVGYENNGTTYSTASTLTINKSITFEAKIVDLVNVVVYRDLSYNGSKFEFTNPTTLNNVEMTRSLLLTDYSTTLVDCTTEGFVVSTDANYVYSTSPSVLLYGSYTLNNTGATKGDTIYFYPVIKTEVKYYANLVLTDSEEVRFGKYPTKTILTSTESEYLASWRVGSLAGEEYTLSPVSYALNLHTIARPFLQMQVVNGDRYISNSSNLVISKLKPSDYFNLPSVSDVSFREPSKYTLKGWNISYMGTFVADSVTGQPHMYDANARIKIDDILTALGIGVDDLVEVYFEMTPVVNYNLHSVSIVDSVNITYDVNVTLKNTSGMTSSQITSYEADFVRNGNVFYILSDGQITISDDKLTFEAYLYNSGSVVMDNGAPVIATIQIAKDVTSGYTSNGWYYAGTSNVLVSGTSITTNVEIVAQTAVASEVTINIGLQYYDGVNYIVVNSTNIGDYKDYFHIDSTSEFAYSVTKPINSIINFAVMVNDGYEVVGLVNESGASKISNISKTGTRHTFTHQIDSDLNIYVVVKKSAMFNPTITLNTTQISSFDSSKIDNSSTMNIQYREDSLGSSWNYLYKDVDKTLYNLIWSEFSADYTYTNSVAINNLIQVSTNINSIYYYVSAINIYFDNVLSMSINSNVFTGEAKVSGAIKIELVLKERTSSINYYDESDNIQNGSATNINDSLTINLPSLTKSGYSLQGFKVYMGANEVDKQFVEYITTNKTFDINDLVLAKYRINRNSGNQNAFILLEPVWLSNKQKVSFVSDNGYFLLNGVQQSSIMLDVDYGEVLTFNKVENSGVIDETSTVEFSIKTCVVNANGEVQVVPATQVVKFVPIGTWKFVNGYRYNTSEVFSSTYTINGDIEFTPIIERGQGSVKVEVYDVTTLSNNSNLNVGQLTFNNGVGSTTNIGYDSVGNMGSEVFNFTTQDNCVVTLSTSSAFSITDVDIEIDGKKLSDYSNLEEFKNAIASLNIEINSNEIVLDDLIYDVKITYVLGRANVSAYVQVTSATAGSELEDVFEELINNNVEIVKVGSTNAMVGSSQEFGNEKLRKVAKYTFDFNDDYFDIDRIYYVDNGTIYNIYGGVVDDALSSFDPLSNELTVVYGGDDGNDLIFYVTLKLKEFKTIFHSENGEYSSLADYSSYSGITPNQMVGYSFNETINVEMSQLFTPNNVMYNGSNLKFVNWTYYNGDYAKDLKNGTIDNAKFVEFTSINWTFDERSGNLHIFSNWQKLFDVKFAPVADGYSAVQNGLPSNMTNVLYGDEINFTIPTRSGFEFGGYKYVFDGDNYYLRYNGTTFEQLSTTTTIETISPFNSAKITLGQILTSRMANLDSTFNTIIFEPIWSRENATLTIQNDAGKGSIETYSFDGTTYTLALVEIKCYDLVEAGVVDLGGSTYNCLYLKNEDGIYGAIVVKPNTSNYYNFDKFTLNGSEITSETSIGENSTIVVEYGVEYVEHTLNFKWDSPVADAKYSIKNLSDAKTKIAFYNGENIERINTLSQNEEIELTNTYDKIIVSVLRDKEVNVKFVFDNYHFGTSEKELILNVVGASNNVSTSGDYVLNIDLVNVSLSQYMLEDITHTSAEGGKYAVSYYAPIYSDGLIVGYDDDVTTIEVDGQYKEISGIVNGTKLYFEKLSPTYEIVELLNGNIDISSSDGGNMYLTVGVGETYDVKVVFDYEYAYVEFAIGGKIYADGYFKTTDGSDKNPQLVAFANMLVDGYSNVTDKSALFDDITALTGSADSVVMSKIVRQGGVNKIYYAEGDFIKMFNYAINENLATTYYEDDSWKNVWFEAFNFALAYPTAITIDDLYVGAGVEAVEFNANTSVALVLSINSDCETIENKIGDVVDSVAVAKGGIVVENTTSQHYEYMIMGSSQLGYNGSYSNLQLKVKDNTKLPKLVVTYDNHTYAIHTIDFSEKVMAKESVELEESDDLLVVDATTLEYTYVHEFKIKQVKLLLNSSDKNDDTNYSFEQNFANADNSNYLILELNYATTFDKIMNDYNLQNEYIVGSKIFEFEGFYSGSTKIDNTSDMTYYFDNINTSYSNGSSINLVAKYKEKV